MISLKSCSCYPCCRSSWRRAAGSKLVELISSGEMPRNAAALSAAEISLIREWIEAGALDN